MDRKKEIRAKILKMRQALPKEEVREKSLRIIRRILIFVERWQPEH